MLNKVKSRKAIKNLINIVLVNCMVTVSPVILNAQTSSANQDANAKVVKTNAEWKKILTPDAYHITREAGTERPYTGKYWDNHDKGIYSCVCCGLNLFSSETKFESGTGWPSFYQPLKKGVLEEKTDSTLGMKRTEVNCIRCDAHLGHVFDDGPKPTGLRYCMNSGALSFTKTK